MDVAVLIARFIIAVIYGWLFWAIYSRERESGQTKMRAILNGAAGAAVFTVLVLIGMALGRP